MPKHLMFDLELASNESGAIIQIGAVWFDPLGKQVEKQPHKKGMNIQDSQFFAVVDLQSLIDARFQLSSTAICWPIKMDARNFEVYAQWENVASSLRDVLTRFKSFIDGKYEYVWSRGQRDVHYLLHAYEKLSLELPFGMLERWRDFRSFIQFRDPNLPWPENLVPHCALDDAIMQARAVQYIYQQSGYYATADQLAAPYMPYPHEVLDGVSTNQEAVSETTTTTNEVSDEPVADGQ